MLLKPCANTIRAVKLIQIIRRSDQAAEEEGTNIDRKNFIRMIATLRQYSMIIGG